MLFPDMYCCIYILLMSVLAQLSEGCKCVPFYLCKNGSLQNATKGFGNRFIPNSQQHCTGLLEYCCQKKSIMNENLYPPPEEKRGCGYRNINSEVAPLFQAAFAEIPWMIAIFFKSENSTKHYYRCGGSLIHPKVVLTAAHCVLEKGKYMVRAGEWDHQFLGEAFKYENQEVESLVTHSRFSKNNFQNDIALLFLRNDYKLVTHINVICLPSMESVVHLNSNECFVSGWGNHSNYVPTLNSSVLKKIELPLVERMQCQEKLRKTRLGKKLHLPKSTLCAGGEKNKDSCRGDGGGPLVCPIIGEKDRYQQVGIVSWGIGCGDKNVPGVYSNVTYLRLWIDLELRKRNINL